MWMEITIIILFFSLVAIGLAFVSMWILRHKQRRAPKQEVQATLVAFRSMESSSSQHYVCFRIKNKEERSFALSMKKTVAWQVGDTGLLRYQGYRFLGFEK
jgi:hypothetical protein